MGLHLAPITNRLRSEHPAVYEHRGAILLALASLAGWACGVTLHLPGPLVLDMAAIVAGGVIVNAAIAELPKEREASFWSFVTGRGRLYRPAIDSVPIRERWVIYAILSSSPTRPGAAPPAPG